MANDHPFYLLTKRPERAAEYTNAPNVAARIELAARAFIEAERAKVVHVKRGVQRAKLTGFSMPAWPLHSVALITSAGTQAGADARVPHLLRCKAAVRGVSCEPMTGPVDFSPWAFLLDWAIFGGESGDMDATREELRPRPCEIAWIDAGVAQFHVFGKPVFVKQLGNVLAARIGRDGKGGALEDLPPRLRVRQFPRMGE